MRSVGTVVRGIRTPIIKYGDNLENVVVDSLLQAAKNERFQLHDKDVIGVTEAVVAISQGNYVTLEQLVKEFKKLYPKKIGVVFPILSRNRFSLVLKAITMACKEVHILFSYPSDEVGNHLVEPELVDEKGVDPHSDVLEEDEFRKLFGKKLVHRFTGVDYVQAYKDLGNGNVFAHFSNNPKTILNYTRDVLVADIHTRFRTKKILLEAGAETLYGLDEICNTPSKAHGYNVDYGLLGSNKTGEEKLKLFPRDCNDLVNRIQKRIKEETGKDVEVIVYGDGAFKDPVGKIWELADPVVCPGFTEGLVGTPKEVKLKYISENWDSKGNLNEYVKKMIKVKNGADYSIEKSLGTTPRRLTDLLGSLCDLTSGSGDKGTPVILVQGYFDDYTVG
ncbi:MAG TPA: coenzyme F420-0:L-glutamate ligase [Candidatus Dojkabacteria bacterium]|nr:coenzyme F420-0:L-glutamate ligase [Candidatus Dojkabacteria bacterium]